MMDRRARKQYFENGVRPATVEHGFASDAAMSAALVHRLKGGRRKASAVKSNNYDKADKRIWE